MCETGAKERKVGSKREVICGLAMGDGPNINVISSSFNVFLININK